MKRAILCLAFAGLLALVAQAAFAADNDSITVTVTLRVVAVSVTPDAPWALGTVPPSESRASWVSGNPMCTATNDGSVNEDLDISASDSANWTHGAASGTDAFVIAFGVGTPPYTSEPTYTAITGTHSLASGVAPSGEVKFDLKFTAPGPLSVADPAGESFTVTVEASAS